MADLSKDDFKALQDLWTPSNKITDVGLAKFVAAIDAGGLPKLIHRGFFYDNPASASAMQAVSDAMTKRSR